MSHVAHRKWVMSHIGNESCRTFQSSSYLNQIKCATWLISYSGFTTTYCNTPQHRAAHCNSATHLSATHSSKIVLCVSFDKRGVEIHALVCKRGHGNALRDTARYHGNALQDNGNALQDTAGQCNAMQHAATNCNSFMQLQLSATPWCMIRRVTAVSQDTFICVPWQIHVCAMTHAYVWHHASICVAWLMHVCGMNHSYVWYHSCICAYVWYHSCISCCITRVYLHMCGITRVYLVRQDLCLVRQDCAFTDVFVVFHMMYPWHCICGIAFTGFHVMCPMWRICGIPYVVFVALHSWYSMWCIRGTPCDVFVALHSWLVCMSRATGLIHRLHCIRCIARDVLVAVHNVTWLVCHALQHTAAHCNTRQHTATRVSTLHYV